VSARVRTLRELRAATGLDRAALARKAEVTPRTLRRWETGETQPRGWRVAMLALALGVTPAEIQAALAEGAREG
jgi:DNA-binding transcriptional regulator YiaG